MKDQLNTVPPELKGIDTFSKLLDTRFTIPGTSIRFGIDFLIGLVPFAGDLAGFLFSAGLVMTMARHGASGQVLAKMIGNVILDTVVGSIPFFGDIFDLFYKSNRRNYHLLEKHYGEGAYQGSVWKVVVPILLVLLLVFILVIWLVFKVFALTWQLVVQ
ncbi:MAG: hypothetical protein DHS20C18_33430 [Saprospiraceae bacterium]|nr:MAG: hypothetical protein DHS20C18_33430 [Saprospiraceae bacterium]